MSVQVTPKCKKCGNRFPMAFNDFCDMPVMVCFETEDGQKISLCRNCLCELGRAKENGTEDEFWDGIL